MADVMELSAGQVGFFMGFGAVVLLYLYAELLSRKSKWHKEAQSPMADIEGAAKETVTPSTPPGPTPLVSLQNPVVEILSLNETTLLENRTTLRDMVEFGMHLLFYFFCDRLKYLPEPSGKNYSRDFFWFVYGILVVYNFAHHIVKCNSVVYLNREQTEEWKGWMQILFLMYHFFNASEQYNAIRIYIAAYVWMTGFGNFSFYYVRKDFSPSRFFQMLWRLNFLVFWVCVVMNNDYMLYYICPMHTIWTIMVYLVLLVGNQHNENQLVIAAKFLFCIAFSYAMWYSAEAFYTIWSPTAPLMGYTDPNPKNPNAVPHVLHEWYFRSGLDRYIWVFGMICANCHPMTDRFLVWLDNQPHGPREVIRTVIAVVLLGVGYWWCTNYFALPKREYNKTHPYTALVPLFIYIILRNLTQTLREYHLAYFAFLGKITLETYIGQFHIWLHTDVPNGQPRTLLTLVPGYPNLNFFVVTPLYLFVSYRIFHLTNQMKVDMLPSKDNPRLYRNLMLVGLTWTVCYGIGRIIKLTS
eukprot:TRINITY_DN1042_c0_g4_i1.p1 TRINITY_DN1042_c0_g4~~TRINITY_DN1042_c0_g4_i1.p1  ORF type:complete len:525 (+),score=162.49 TRINITY_DN1042_c0_g4_i1:144-1718(+)